MSDYTVKCLLFGLLVGAFVLARFIDVLRARVKRLEDRFK